MDGLERNKEKKTTQPRRRMDGWMDGRDPVERKWIK
jgi:hypothetical protein